MIWLYNAAMANGEEDLREKNRDREKPKKTSHYRTWTSSFGREDAEMLQEKSEHWSALKSSRGDYDQD